MQDFEFKTFLCVRVCSWILKILSSIYYTLDLNSYTRPSSILTTYLLRGSPGTPRQKRAPIFLKCCLLAERKQRKRQKKKAVAVAEAAAAAAALQLKLAAVAGPAHSTLTWRRWKVSVRVSEGHTRPANRTSRRNSHREFVSESLAYAFPRV